ncbi:hypothetical protein Enr13x_45590 [Stieleria neptunia]|uniref:Uncharacterized protein n=1 Tax=Stieleria neptunia TaxID=2527979 RepID=A0A518HUZ5_9BACT|nr:hypothetical protein Enr13x_45590 [Stieleria neptunia]
MPGKKRAGEWGVGWKPAALRGSLRLLGVASWKLTPPRGSLRLPWGRKLEAYATVLLVDGSTHGDRDGVGYSAVPIPMPIR